MADREQTYLRDVQYRFPDRLKARTILHRRYGRGDWFEWLATHIPLTPGAIVADIGCGAGAFWTNAPPTLPSDLKLRLSDLSPGMAEAARAAIMSLNRWRDVEVEVADAAALPLADASIDTTLAVHMLYHLADPGLGLAEMARVTRPGGSVAVVLNPRGTMAELSALVDAASIGETTQRREPLSSEEGLALMRRLFFHVDVIRYDDQLRVTDPVDLLGYLTSLPEADAPGVADKMMFLIEQAFHRAGGVFTITKSSELLLGKR